MAQAKKSSRSRRPPAKTAEARENQIIAKAVDLAEKQIEEGTASTQVITHYLKLASSREKLEKEKIEMSIALDKAKAESYSNEKKTEELYYNAMKAMSMYKGQEVFEEDED